MDMFIRSLRILPAQRIICAPRKALIASLMFMNSSFQFRTASDQILLPHPVTRLLTENRSKFRAPFTRADLGIVTPAAMSSGIAVKPAVHNAFINGFRGLKEVDEIPDSSEAFLLLDGGCFRLDNVQVADGDLVDIHILVELAQ